MSSIAAAPFVSDVADLWAVPVVVFGMLAALTAVVRLTGVRSLSKMTSFDFAVTVSLGSVLASIATLSTPLLDGVVAVAALLGIQTLIAFVRRRYDWAQRSVDNVPVMLMDGRTILHDNVRSVRMTTGDVYTQLRIAGVTSLDQVGAVILETTGDVSVLASSPIDDELLDGVNGRPAVR